jgi:hypothetical protein
MELRHLGRDVKTALELAIVGLCPGELVDRLATAAGLIDAIAELPMDSPAVGAMVPAVSARALRALEGWNEWREGHLSQISA